MNKPSSISCLLVCCLMQISTSFGQIPDETLTEDEPQTIAELLSAVREGSAAQRADMEAREQRFRDARDEQSALLAEATAQREAEEREADRLRELYQQGEDELARLEDLLTEQSGDLSNVFSVVTQVASDALPMIQNSMVSAQYGNRLPLLEQLSDGETIPSANQLRELWLLLLDEMNYSGQIARFETPIISGEGTEELRRVTRIGTFSAISEGEYLRFLPESGRLLALARQPTGLTSSNALEFENASEPLLSVAIDPSRGSILSLIVQSPELSDRIEQGGYIGYVIIAIGLIGLIIGLERMIMLLWAGHRANLAFKNPDMEIAHPVSAIRAIASNPDYLTDADAMSAKLDEIVASAAQELRRGLPTLAIFAAVSPLLGLLGTVTGMIETFQVITLFGAGDPRLMSGGISQALITTQLGLAVAIPLLLVHSFLQGRANSLIAALDETAADEFARHRSGKK